MKPGLLSTHRALRLVWAVHTEGRTLFSILNKQLTKQSVRPGQVVALDVEGLRVRPHPPSSPATVPEPEEDRACGWPFPLGPQLL